MTHWLPVRTLPPGATPSRSSLSSSPRPPIGGRSLGDISNEVRRGHYHRGSTGKSAEMIGRLYGSARLRTGRPEALEEALDAIHDGGRGRIWLGVRSLGLCGDRGIAGFGGGGQRVTFNAALENESRPHANAAHQDDQFWIWLVLYFGGGIITKWRHIDLIGWLGGGRFRKVRGLGGGRSARRRNTWRSIFAEVF